MRTTKRIWMAGLLAGAVATTTTTGGLAHSTPLPVEILSLEAAATGTDVAVSGEVAFGGQEEVVVGEDPAGDNLGGAQTAALGVDVTELRINQPDSGADELLFTIQLADAPPGLGGLPETVQYNWDIAVDGGAENGGSNWSIKAMRTRASATGTVSAYAAIFDCQPNADGGFSCSEVAELDAVEFEPEEAAIRIAVPFSTIGAGHGSTIDPFPRCGGTTFWIGPSASGVRTFCNIYDSMDFYDTYTVPDHGTVMLGLAASGETLVHDTPATVESHHHEGEEGTHAEFHGTLTAPEPGEYTVGALACFAGECAARATIVTAG